MNDTPRTNEAAGTPSNNWQATAERLFKCSAQLERENNQLRAALVFAANVIESGRELRDLAQEMRDAAKAQPEI